MSVIPFHTPFLSSTSLFHLQESLTSPNSLFRGRYHQRCTSYFDTHFFSSKSFLVSSCTEGLVMALVLLDLQPGDEVIVPSFTFVSVVNVLVNRGCVVRFVDCLPGLPVLSEASVQAVVTDKTKAVIDLYYGGIVVKAHRELYAFCRSKGIYYIADAAHVVFDAGLPTPLSSLADITVFSFHETKPIQSGQGGLLVLHLPDLWDKATAVYNHGTDKREKSSLENSFYQWIAEGLEFNLNELSCALLWSQLEQADELRVHYFSILSLYTDRLKTLTAKGKINSLSPVFATDVIWASPSLFYLVTYTPDERRVLQQYLSNHGVDSRAHYAPLHESAFYTRHFDSKDACPQASHFSQTMLRLPIGFYLNATDIEYITDLIHQFYENGTRLMV